MVRSRPAALISLSRIVITRRTTAPAIRPLLALPAHTSYVEPVGENHSYALPFWRRKVRQQDCFPCRWSALGKALLENRGRTMHAAGNIAVDRWQGGGVCIPAADLAVSE